MATIFFAWELGEGLGHLVNLRPLVAGLIARGHRVAVAVRDLSRARKAFPPQTMLLQSPFKTSAIRRSSEVCTFAHVLQDVGFGDAEELAALVGAWQSLYDLVRPDVIVCEHSPTALLAARGGPARTVFAATGFFCPPDESPLPNLRPWLNVDPQQLLRDEHAVLANINRVLEERQRPVISRVTQLYADLDERFLLTFRELEHYPARVGGQYCGLWTESWGKPAAWPKADGPRIFVYQKPTPALPGLFAALRMLGASVLGYVDGFSPKLREQYSDERTMLLTEPVDLTRVARECDVAVLNGNHGTTTSMLLAGKPVLQIPIYLEQALSMQAAVRTGAALAVSPTGTDPTEARLRALIENPLYAAAARAFAARYATYDPIAAAGVIINRIEELAAA